MERSLTSPARCELRCVTRFLCPKNTAPNGIHSQLCEVYEQKCMSIQHGRKCWREFKKGRTDVQDEHRSGRPSVFNETIAKGEETMLKDPKVTIWELTEIIHDVRKAFIDRSCQGLCKRKAERRDFKLPSWRGRKVLGLYKLTKDRIPHAKMHRPQRRLCKK